MPSPFTGSLSITSLDDDCYMWRLNEPLMYEVGHIGSGNIIIVPAGFVTDGASTYGLITAWDNYSRAAILHDYLYACIETGRPHPAAMKWKQADAIFYEALRVSKVNLIMAFCMWAIVRAIGRVLKRES